jgi:hypothetical protein
MIMTPGRVGLLAGMLYSEHVLVTRSLVPKPDN